MNWPSGKKRAGITRRNLLRATAATAGVATAVSILPGCTNKAKNQEGEPTVVDTGAADYVINPTNNESNYDSVDNPLKEAGSFSIPVGNVLHPGEGTWIPVTTAGSSATPMVKGSAFSTTTGSMVEVVSKPIAGDENNVVIYDVRCSDSVYAWVEISLLTREWTLYAARFSEGKLQGNPTTLWSADANFDPARFVVTDSSVIWLVMPSTSGNKTTEHSFCYLWKAGDSNAKAVVESPGRFATDPVVSDGAVTLTPRVNASEGTFYGITAYSLSDDLSTQEGRLVLPASVRPLNAVRMGDKFVFSIEASYASGGLLGKMGTYIGDGNDKFVVLSREPFADVAGKDGLYLIKSSSSYFVINTNDRSYSVLSAANHCIDYGEYPARVGTCSTFATFSTVKDQNTGYSSSVNVRLFTFP